MKHHTQKPLPPDDRTKTIGAVSWDALWAATLKPEPNRPEGAGWKSTPELMRETGATKQAVRWQMEKRQARGQIERAYGRSPSGQRVTYYRPIPNKHPTARPLL